MHTHVHNIYNVFLQSYQLAMLKVIPHLQFLDQKPLTAEAAKQGYLVSQSSLLRYKFKRIVYVFGYSFILKHVCMYMYI